jgi:hypothetical protein
MDRRSDYKTSLLIDAVLHDVSIEARPAARELATLGRAGEHAQAHFERRHQVTPEDVRNAP